jgi:hypothetical protein
MVNDSLPEGNSRFSGVRSAPLTVNRVEVHCFVGRAVSYLGACFC